MEVLVMVNPRTLRPKFGTHVTGAGFWNALPKPEDLVVRLGDGESIKIFGLRRIGKSSLLYETARILAGTNRTIVQLDGQQLHSIPSLLNEIIGKLPTDKGLVHRLLDFSNRAGLPPALKAKFEAIVTEKIVGNSEPALDAYAELLFKELGRAFAALPTDQRPVLFIDELPWFCDNVMKATPSAEREAATARLNNLLAVLRSWRGEEIGVTMAICGSLSMAWLQREHGVQSEHLNDCLPIQIEELSQDDAVAMVEAMIAHANPSGWESGVAGRLCQLLPSLFPGVVQFAFSVIRLETDLTLARLEDVFREMIADGLQTNYYSQFDKRIGHYEDAERNAVYALFAAIFKAEAGSVTWDAAETLCAGMGRMLLDRLVEDGFIRASRSAGIRFASGLAVNWHKGRE